MYSVLNIYIPNDDFKEKIRKLSKKRGMSISKFVVSLIQKELAKDQEKNEDS